jgi:hypothetical protein
MRYLDVVDGQQAQRLERSKRQRKSHRLKAAHLRGKRRMPQARRRARIAAQ